MKWVIHGFYGFGNFGDDLMMIEVVKNIKEISDPKAEILLLVKDLSKIDFILARFKNLTVKNFPKGNWNFLRLIKNYDRMVFGGGTAFHEFGQCNPYWNIIAKFCGLKIYWIGLGVEEFISYKSLFKGTLALACCTNVCLRDLDSLNKLEKQFSWFKRKQLAADIVLLCHNPDLSSPSSQNVSNKKMVVSWGNRLTKYISNIQQDKLLDIVINHVELWVKSYSFKSVIIADFINFRDEAANDYIYQKIFDKLKYQAPDIVVSRNSNPNFEEKINLIKDSNFLFSARMHPFMYAKLLNKSAICWQYASKIKSFSNLLSMKSTFSLEEIAMDSNFLNKMFKRELYDPSVVLDFRRLQKSAKENFYSMLI